MSKSSPQYPRETLDRIRNAVALADLVSEHTELKPTSSGHVCPCLFHQETKPSMNVFPDGHFHCYGCQANGDIFDFVQRIEGVGFNEAVQRLAERAHIPLETANLEQKRSAGISRMDHVAICKNAAGFYQEQLNGPTGAKARDYLLKQRGLAPEIIEAFGLGLSLDLWDGLKRHLKAKGWKASQALGASLVTTNGKGIFDSFRNRIMFPIHETGGSILGFGGRTMDDDGPKYINSAECDHFKKARLLYGLFQARKAIGVRNQVLVTEGYVDVLGLHQFGFDNSVGVLGTAFGTDHVSLLARLCEEFVFLFDGDAPGRKAAFRSVTLTLQAGISCRVVMLPDGEDADSLLQAHGRKALDDLLSTAPRGLDFCFDYLKAAAPRTVVAWIKEILEGLKDKRLRAIFVPRIAQGLQLSEFELRQWEEAKAPEVEEPLALPILAPLNSAQKESAPADPMVSVKGQEVYEQLLQDIELLWGFVARRDYCDIFMNRQLPFSTKAGQRLFEKLCMIGDSAQEPLTREEEAFVETCRERNAEAEVVYKWYSEVKKKAR